MRRLAARTGFGSLALVLALAVTGCGSAEPPAPVPAPAPPAAPEPTTSRSAAPTACEDTTLRRLSPRERAAQLIMIGVPADGVTGAARTALRAGPGGVILTDATGGGQPSRSQVARTVREAVSAAGEVRPLVATDQEGGKVQDLKGADFARIPPAAEQGRDPAGLRAGAAGWGRDLAAAGVTVDLAPVADVVDPGLGTRNAPVGALGRGFGTDAARVGRAVDAFVSGMADAGVSTTLKHFPGLGRVRQNTDFAGGVTDGTTRRGGDLDTFRAGIGAGAGLVMMSSARYTQIDPRNQALFSSTIMRDVLRGDLGFRGVIVTDDVGAAAALADVPVAQRAVRFVDAGGDLVLTIKPGDLAPMVDALATRAEADPAFRARVDDAARRVLALKVQRAELRC